MNNQMSDSKETQSAEATPEQLMQMLNRELATHRSQRPKANRNRAMILVIGVLFIVMAAGAAFVVLDQMLQDFRQNGQTPQPASAPTQTNF
jgi:hypothetical protein